MLVLENDAPIRALTEAVLELSRFEVHAATSIEDASPLLRELVPDVVVIDLELPEGGARRAIEALRADHADGVRLIGIAGAGQVVGEGSGCDAVLRKPHALAALPRALEVLVRARDEEELEVAPIAAIGDRLFVREDGEAVGLVRAVGARGVIASAGGEDVIVPREAIAAAHGGKVLVDLGAVPAETCALLSGASGARA